MNVAARDRLVEVGDRVHAVDLVGEPVEGVVIQRVEVMPVKTWRPGRPLDDGPTLFVRDEVNGVAVLVKESSAIRRARPAGRKR